MGKPSGTVTFGDQTELFYCNIFRHLKCFQTRNYIVFDDYTIQSIKSGTREQRNTKHRKIRRIFYSCKIRLPPVWPLFISLGENKKTSYTFPA